MGANRMAARSRKVAVGLVVAGLLFVLAPEAMASAHTCGSNWCSGR